MSDDATWRILYVQTTGAETPAKSATVFFRAASAAALDMEIAVDGIFVAGAAAGPKDLDDTIRMAGSAAMKAAGFVRKHAKAAVA